MSLYLMRKEFPKPSDSVGQAYRWQWRAMRLREEADKLQIEVDALRQTEASMKASLSWRLTAPLRWLDGLSRKKKSRDKSTPSRVEWVEQIPVGRGGGRILADCSMTFRGKSSPGMRRVTNGIVKGALKAGVPLIPVDLLEGIPRQADVFSDGRTTASTPMGDMTCDAFLLLDASWEYLASLEPLLRRLRKAGVPVFAVVHDTIPLDHPHLCLPQVSESFGPWLDSVFRHCDGVVCVSETTAARARYHLSRRCPDRVGCCAVLSWLPGNETWGGEPSSEELVPPDDFVLCVGTIEPRKNYGFLLEAVGRLWSEQSWPCRLVVVGERGWATDALFNSLEKHDEWGKKLWWFEQATDDHLHALYHSCQALAVPSIDEGFSQPLSEAAALQKPVVLSDIPVFRERVFSGGSFFAPGDLKSLQSALVEAAGPSALPPQIKRTTWEKSAQELAGLLVERRG